MYDACREIKMRSVQTEVLMVFIGSHSTMVPTAIFCVCKWVLYLSHGDTVAFITADITGTVQLCNVTQTMLNGSVPEVRILPDSNINPLFVIVAAHWPVSKGWKSELWLSSILGVELRTSEHGHERTNMHARWKKCVSTKSATAAGQTCEY